MMKKTILIKVLSLLLLLALAAPVSAEETTDPSQETTQTVPGDPDAGDETDEPDEPDPEPVYYDYTLTLVDVEELKKEKTTETSVTFFLPVPDAVDGKTFKGWAYAEDGEVVVDADVVEFTLTADDPDVTLYPVWESNTYTITYEAYETEDPITEKEYNSGEEITIDYIPQRPGYEFLCWVVKKTDGSWDKGKEIFPGQKELSGMYGNVTLEAEWEKAEYTIEFDCAGGPALEPVIYKYGDELELEKPMRDGYEFLGWILENPGNGNWMDSYNGNDYIEADETLVPELWGDVVLKAEWAVVEYDITFETGDGDNVNSIKYNVNSPLSLPVSQQIGYTFLGWEVTSDEGNWNQYLMRETDAEYFTADEDAVIEGGLWGDVTLTAVWDATDYAIEFEMGEDEAITSIEYNIASDAVILPIPEKLGYDFAGWEVKPNGGECAWPEEITPDENEDGIHLRAGYWGHVLLTPIWVEQEALIEYVVVGIGGSVELTSEKVGAVNGLPCAEFKPDAGYAFAGWFTDEQCENLVEKDLVDKENGLFKPAKDEETGIYENAVYYVKFELQLGNLILSADGISEDQSLIFDIEGDPDAEELDPVLLTVALPAGETEIVICDLPVGAYTIAERSGWSWRYEEADSITEIVAASEEPDPWAEIEDENETDEPDAAETEEPESDEPVEGIHVLFGMTQKTDLWLSYPMYSAEIRKKED